MKHMEESMRKSIRLVVIAAICGVAMLSSGCMGLSLFTSTHTHYHGGAELEKRVEVLEQRIDIAGKDRAGEVVN